ncbi:Uncharacterised protein [Mycobacteroides abscessus subsp. abscessus]|nr:Uncharacterised protein [Mycobacteroides abscessus subsp. abscessus]
MGLVNHKVVTPTLLKPQTAIFALLLGHLFEPGIEALLLCLDALLADRGYCAILVVVEFVELLLNVFALGFLVDSDCREQALGHDDHVPVGGRGLGHEAAPTLGIGARLAEQYARRWIPLGGFAADLLHDVVRNDKPRLGNQAETLEFHHAHQARSGLPGSNDMVQKYCGLSDYPRHRVALVMVRLEFVGQAGQGQVVPVVIGGHEAVEPAVEFGDENVAAGVVGENPLLECLGDLRGFSLGGRCRLEIECWAACFGDYLSGPVDDNGFGVAEGIEYVDGVFGLGAPRLGHGDRAAEIVGAFHRPGATDVIGSDLVGSERLPRELGDVFSVDPGRAGASLDL